MGGASGSVAAGRKASASNVFQKSPAYGPDKAFDDDDDTRWATDSGTSSAWLEVDLAKEVALDRAVIREAFDRVEEFELQARSAPESEWRAFARGTRIGEKLELRFEAVRARFVRLRILRASEGPTIWELQLFGPKG